MCNSQQQKLIFVRRLTESRTRKMPAITKRGKEANEVRFQELQVEDPQEDNREVDDP